MDSVEEMAKRTREVHIPEEIIFDHILPRLPVKPLGKFMLVKKSWYAYVKSSRFVRRHFDHSVSCKTVDASRDYLLHTCFWSKDQTNCGQLFTNGLSGYEKTLDVKFPKFVGDHEYQFVVVGSFNGLVCLSEDDDCRYGRRIYFWNPLIGKLRANVDSTCDDVFDRSSWVGLGFWYDYEENDHKLVRLVYYEPIEGPPEFEYCHVEVYNLGTDSWRKIGNREVNPIINSLTGGVLVNGYFYWLATYSEDDVLLEMILCFDVKNEVFKTLEWPFYTSPLLMDYQGCLAAFLGRTLLVLRAHDEGSSWKKMFNVVTQESIQCSLGISKNGGILLLTDDLHMIEYDSQNQNVKNIGISEYEYDNHMATYRESLLLLDEEVDNSAKLDGHATEEDELEKEETKDPREQENM